MILRNSNAATIVHEVGVPVEVELVDLPVAGLAQRPLLVVDEVPPLVVGTGAYAGHPGPRLNFAPTLEQAGRIDDALTEYGAALEGYPGHIQTLLARSRCVLRYRSEYAREDATLPSDLREISLRGETAQWREWAQTQLIRLESRPRR